MKRTILAMAILSMAIVLHAQKFGHVTSEQLLQAMPEYDSAQAKVQALQQQYELEIERIQVEINKKIEEFNQTESTMSELIKEAKASEIQEMQMRLQNFSQTAQQDLQQQTQESSQPQDLQDEQQDLQQKAQDLAEQMQQKGLEKPAEDMEQAQQAQQQNPQKQTLQRDDEILALCAVLGQVVPPLSEGGRLSCHSQSRGEAVFRIPAPCRCRSPHN